jgi:Clostripain family
MANDWLFMLYLSGDNSLSAEMIWALNEIQGQKLPDGVKMTILYDPLSPCCPSYVFNLHGNTTTGPEGAQVIDRTRVPPLPLLTWMKDDTKMMDTSVFQWVEDSSDSETLRKFVEWSVAEQPSEYRMLILSGHGSGAVGDFLPDDHAKDGQPGSLTIPALKKALDTAQIKQRYSLKPNRKLIDILGMDSCLMSMAEVGYQVRNTVEYLVGSEGFVQEAGWPYGFLLKRLREHLGSAGTASSAILPSVMAANIVKDYIAYYRTYLPADVSVDMAACELATLGQGEPSSPSLRSTVRTLTDILIKKLDLPAVRDSVILAHWRAQSYKFEQYTDLWDFCGQLRELSEAEKQADIALACRNVQDAIDRSVGRTNGTDGRQDYEGIEFQYSRGLSVFFPWSSKALSEADKAAYRALDFGLDTGWGAFLEEYLFKTMRGPRKEEGQSIAELQLFGRGSEDAERKAPHAATEGVRNAPHTSRNAPHTSRMLELLLDSLNPAGMKNPPQSVYLRPDPKSAAKRSSYVTV